MVHRAILGTFERFLAIITEHLDGKYPVWLAPEQVRILPISDDNLEYAHRLKEQLLEYRVTIEDRQWTIDHKIQNAHEYRVPYMLIIGDQEESAETISVRDRDNREQNGVSIADFLAHMAIEESEKTLKPSFLAD